MRMSGGPFENYQRQAESTDERFDFMDFSDFQDLQNLEEGTRRKPDDYDNTDSFYQMKEENNLRQMEDEDLKQGGPNKRLMTRDAWDESQEQTDFQAGEERGNMKHQDMEQEKMKEKVTKSKRKSSAWDDFVGDNDLDEDTQPWTPVTSAPRSPEENV